MATDNYYIVLGIDKTSEIIDIKRAYRAKAKLYHPDINKSPDAHDKFIEINEAYEYLLSIKTGKVFAGNDFKRSNYNARERQRQWESRQREQARERAREYAREKFSEYEKSKIYKTTETLSSMADYFIIAFAILAPLGAIYGVFRNGLYYVQNGVEKFDYMAVFTAFFIFLFGLGIISVYVYFGRKK